MIPQLLNRDFVTRQGMKVVAGLERTAGPDDPMVREVVTALHGAAMVPSEVLSKPDEVAFIPSHPQLSIIQALADQAAHQGELYEGDEHGGGKLILQQPDAQLSPLVTQQIVRVEPDGSGLEAVDEFEPADPRWWGRAGLVAAQYLAARIKFRIPEEPPATFALSEGARVILVGDWGTGAHDARSVSTAIKAAMAEAEDRQCHVVHLGDVYYAGTKWEAQHRFLDPWPVEPGQAESYYSWTLNGNHDMYAAGEGLFEVTLPDRRFAHQRTAGPVPRPTSLFRLANDHWQIIGLDSSWEFHLLDPGNMHGALGEWQSGWLEKVTDSSANTIVLSHHHPFSRDRPFPAPLTLEERLLSDTAGARDHGLTAWFWGHEHRCISYQSPAITGLDYGACVGNGGVPKQLGKKLAGGGEWEFRGTNPPDWDGEVWRQSGFAVIDFRPGARPTVAYRDQNGLTCRDPDVL